jgi:hypothetical protein
MDDRSTGSMEARHVGVLSATLAGLGLAGAVTTSLSTLFSMVEALLGLGVTGILLRTRVFSSAAGGSSMRSLVAGYAAVVIVGGIMAVYAPAGYAALTWAIVWMLVLVAAHVSGRPAVLAEWVASLSHEESARQRHQ